MNNKFSTAGFYPIDEGKREVYSFNPSWSFYKGQAVEAWKQDFDDSNWTIVNLPHGIEELPFAASGSINYQGEVWYRKKFSLDQKTKGRKTFLHFEAIMGKSKIWVNGQLKAEHFGGFLPIVIDITDDCVPGQENVIAVWADNNDDESYPPGKPQQLLDWTYFGGIYRDVWLYTTDYVHITDSMYVDKEAGGGVFVHYEHVSQDLAEVVIKTNVVNETNKSVYYQLVAKLVDQNQKLVAEQTSDLTLTAGENISVTQHLSVENPQLWYPHDPNLYNLDSVIVTENNEPIDGLRTKIGIRSIEFRGADGFFLNGEAYEEKLIGVNRHQDYAYVGNALPNSGHWRDVQKLVDAGITVVRAAHYPQDPAFMDACDQLGIFVIVATPGWQFFNPEQEFVERVYADIRNMVRRDRNHPSVLFWEPILNETRYSREFVEKVHQITHAEYPYPGCYTAGDDRLEINHVLDIMYGADVNLPDKPYFNREWGDNVDNWSDQNANNRVNLAWGEGKQLKQAMHFLETDYPFVNFASINKLPRQHVGGTLWAGIDHQRGYHPDPFWGGIMDAARQEKYAYYAFQSQLTTEPMVFIAHEMTPFSGSDITVFTNCDQVKLTVYGEEFGIQESKGDLKHPPVVFKNAFDFWTLKNRLYNVKEEVNVEIIAEGYNDGKLVARDVQAPAKRKTKLVLEPDFCKVALQADGADFVPVTAYITDSDGVVKRLATDRIRFEVEGEGTLVTEPGSTDANWGQTTILVRSTTKPGKIKVRASSYYSGGYQLAPAELEIDSHDPVVPLYGVVDDDKVVTSEVSNEDEASHTQDVTALERRLQEAEAEIKRLRLEKVYQDQTDFG